MTRERVTGGTRCDASRAARRLRAEASGRRTPAAATYDFFEDFLPPSRPAARFCDFEPPLPLPLFLPPLLDASGELAIDAARCLLIPFLRSPSYCLSSFTLEP